MGALAIGAVLRWRKKPSACPYSQRFWVEAPHPFITRGRLLQALDPQPGERILEIGPGTGYYTLDVAQALLPNGALEAGAGDSRLVSLLSWIAERHTISITVFKTGHSKYTRSGSISNHYVGRGADIFIIDGLPVSVSNRAGREMVLEVAGLRGPIRPTEIGHPYGAVGFPGGFTDADHSDHIHLGFD